MKKLFLLLVLSAILFSCKKRVNACFDYSPSHPGLGDTVLFDGSCSEHASSYQWSFGDGTQDTTSAATTSHAYTSPGVYTVYLNVDGSKSRLLKSNTQISREIIVE